MPVPREEGVTVRLANQRNKRQGDLVSDFESTERTSEEQQDLPPWHTHRGYARASVRRSPTKMATSTHHLASSGGHPTPHDDNTMLLHLIRQSVPLLSALPDATFICDRSGRIAYLNGAARMLIGLPPSEASNGARLDLADYPVVLRLRERDGQPLAPDGAVVTRILGGDVVPSTQAVTYLATTVDGREAYLSFYGSPVRDERGTIQGALITGHDVTARHAQAARQEATRRAYQAQNARFRTLLDLLPAGVAIYDAQGELIDLNATGQRMTQRQVLPGEAAPDRQARYAMRHADGSMMPEEESPSGRSRRGIAFTDVEYIIDGVHGPDTHILTSGTPLPADSPLEGTIGATAGDPTTSGEPSGSIVVFQDVTELRRLERLARGQADLAEAIIDSSPFGIALFDVTDDFHCIRHNAPYLDLVGADLRARGSLLGVGMDEFFDAESGARTRAVFEHVRATGESVIVDEYEAILPPDPTPRYYRWSLRPLRDTHGAIVVLVVTALEITREVRSRREAEELARRLQTVLDVMPMGVGIVDAEGRILHINDAYRQVWEGEVPLSSNIAEYAAYRGWWPDGRPLAADDWAMARALREGESVAGDEVEIETFNGRRKTILNNAAPVVDERGRVMGGVVAFLDITGRRQLEARTRESLDALLALASVLVSGHPAPTVPSAEERAVPNEAPAGEAAALRAMMRQVAALSARTLGCRRVAISTVDSSSEVMTPIAILGFTPDQEARWWTEWQPNCTVAQRMGEAVAARLRQGEVVRIDIEEPQARRRLHHFTLRHLLVAPMRVDGQVVGMLAFDDAQAEEDFTQRDEALASAVGQLAALVIERDRLLRARAEADARVLALSETNRLMNDFLGIAGHELRTPLTSMRVNAQLAKMSAKRAQERESLAPDLVQALARIVNVTERIDLQSRRQERLVNDLLDVSRLDAGRLELHARPIDLGALAREAVEEQRMLNPSRSITLRVEPAPRVTEHESGKALVVVADPDRVSQVITNYLSNALKYSPPAAPVEVRRVGDSARLSVRDFGPGIPPAEQASVWQRFHRVAGIDVQSGSGIGLGLGLYICRELIERNGGTVGLESTPGDGSTFSFSLPLA